MRYNYIKATGEERVIFNFVSARKPDFDLEEDEPCD